MASACPRELRADSITAVPVDCPRVDLGQDLGGSALIWGVDCGSQAVLGVVHELESFLIVLHLLNSDDGPERFLSHEAHGAVHIHKDRGFEEVTRSFDPLTATKQLCAFALGVLDLLF